MIKREEVYKIGTFHKPHGLGGELLLTFSDDVFERTACEYIICLIDGILVPFFIEDIRYHSDFSAFVKLEGVDSVEQAQVFAGIDVYFPTKYMEVEKGILSWDSFVDFDVTDVCTQKVLGKIQAVDESTVNVLFVVGVYGSGEELLIPACEEFIEEIDCKAKKVFMKLPDGLLSLKETDGDEI